MLNDSNNTENEDNDLFLEILSLSNQLPRIKTKEEKRNKHNPEHAYHQRRRVTALKNTKESILNQVATLGNLLRAKQSHPTGDCPELIESITKQRKAIYDSRQRLRKYEQGKLIFTTKDKVIEFKDHDDAYIFLNNLLNHHYCQWQKFTTDKARNKLIADNKYGKRWTKKYGESYYNSRQMYYDRLKHLSLEIVTDKSLYLNPNDAKWLMHFVNSAKLKLIRERSYNYTLPKEEAPHLTNPDYRREVHGEHRKMYHTYDLEEITSPRTIKHIMVLCWGKQLREDERDTMIEVAEHTWELLKETFVEKVENVCLRTGHDRTKV